MSKNHNILMFSEIGLKDLALVGGKNASLGELRSIDQINVPDGFAITTNAHRIYLDSIRQQIQEIIDSCNFDKPSSIEEASKTIRKLIEEQNFPQELEKEILKSYKKINTSRGVAVRSSATADDLPTASFAGQQDSFLNVFGPNDLLNKIKKCFSSLYTARAISYRRHMNIPEDHVYMSVAVQEMVRADRGGLSGVLFTTDTETGNPNVVLITTAKGLGEAIVQGEVGTDEIYVLKHNCKVIQNPTHLMTDDEYCQLSRWATQIEHHYREKYKNDKLYMDIEWSKDGETDELFILQARPETIHSQSIEYERFYFKEKVSDKEIIVKGRPIGEKIGTGEAKVLKSVAEIDHFNEGEVLVTEMTTPDWEPIMKIAGAIVTNQGGRTCHAAIVARELGIPCLVGAENATKLIHSGEKVTVSCVQGEQGVVFRGEIPFTKETVNVNELPETKTRIMLNVGSPDIAFSAARLPNQGVGLARVEFILSSSIQNHPMYLIKLGRQQEFVDKLAKGIARIAAAFYPNDVIVRFSDFKSNEYANLKGGKDFEPTEENPMIGWRGASRYYDPKYEQAFYYECQAMNKVIDNFGLDNVKVMVPFVRTLSEAKKVTELIRENGVKAEIYMMAEIPSNAILIDKFLDYFDGVSIGSNDLTQTTLGLDRDSAQVNHLYDERNEAVKYLISNIIKGCKKRAKKVGICGQAPSDMPDFTEFLVKEGIDSISVTPDVAVKTRLMVHEYEAEITKQKSLNKEVAAPVVQPRTLQEAVR